MPKIYADVVTSVSSATTDAYTWSSLPYTPKTAGTLKHVEKVGAETLTFNTAGMTMSYECKGYASYNDENSIPRIVTFNETYTVNFEDYKECPDSSYSVSHTLTLNAGTISVNTTAETVKFKISANYTVENIMIPKVITVT